MMSSLAIDNKPLYVHAEAWVVRNKTLVVWDPNLITHVSNSLFCECQLGLPASKRQPLLRDGYTSYVRVERSFEGIGRVFQGVDYSCGICKGRGAGMGYYNSLSPHIIKQLNPMLLPMVDFVPGGKFIISRSTQTLIVASMEQGGCAFEKIEKISARVVATELAHAEELRMLCCEARVRAGLNSTYNPQNTPGARKKVRVDGQVNKVEACPECGKKKHRAEFKLCAFYKFIS